VRRPAERFPYLHKGRPRAARMGRFEADLVREADAPAAGDLTCCQVRAGGPFRETEGPVLPARYSDRSPPAPEI
jgi:hypothetical protein